MESFLNAYYFSLISHFCLVFTVREGIGNGAGRGRDGSPVAPVRNGVPGSLVLWGRGGSQALSRMEPGLVPAATLSHSKLGDPFHLCEPQF